MKKIILFLLTLGYTLVLQAQVKPVFQGSTKLVEKFRTLLDQQDMEGMGQIWSSKTYKDDTKKLLQQVHTTYGPVMYALVSDSSYKKSKSDPKTFVEINYVAWYEKAMLEEKFILVEEKGKLKLGAYVHKAGYGNYNDPFMNFGLQQAGSIFINLVAENKIAEAYDLFTPEFSSIMPVERMGEIVETVKTITGEFVSCDPITSCSALLLRKEGESCAMGLYRVGGTKDTVYLELKTFFANKRFYLYGFQFFTHYSLDNIVELELAGNMVDQVIYAKTNNTIETAYQVLHPELQAERPIQDFTNVLTQLEGFSGKIKKNTMVGHLFCRSGNDITDNEYMMLTEMEGEKATFIVLFLFAYDANLDLKVRYLYFNQF